MNLSREIRQVSFGDARINRRCKQIVHRVSASPARSFPNLAQDRGTLKAYYRFFGNPRVSRTALLSPHVQQTVERCRATQTLLLVQDTTTLSYPQHARMSGLGYVGTPGQLGYGMLVHNMCAVAAHDHELLGLLHQQVIVRTVVHGDRKTPRKRLHRHRESSKWIVGVHAARRLLSAGSHIIHVADREADMFPLMRCIADVGQAFVIRQVRDRKTDTGYLDASIAQAKPVGTMQVKVQRNGTRRARTARVRLRTASALVAPPKITHRVGTPLEVNILVVEEINPPISISPLRWVLLTSEPADTRARCIQIVRHYQARWLVEEFHKALKTGCAIERRQLTTRHRLENALGVFSIISIALLELRRKARNSSPRVPCALTQTQQTILRQLCPSLPSTITNAQALRHIATLGGFLARPRDGDPGWITLMKGYEQLLTLERGYHVALKVVGKG